MARRKKEQEWFCPGGSDMTMNEAFGIVMELLKRAGEIDDRQQKAVKLIHSLWLGTYGGLKVSYNEKREKVDDVFE